MGRTTYSISEWWNNGTMEKKNQDVEMKGKTAKLEEWG